MLLTSLPRVATAMSNKVIKSYLKSKDENIRALTKKAVATAKQRGHIHDIDDELMLTTCPSFSSFIDPITSRINEAKVALESGSMTVKDGLESLSDLQLTQLLKIFKPTKDDKEGEKRGKEYTEDKLVATCQVMFQEMQTMEKAMTRIKVAQNNLIQTFIMSYGNSYHFLKGNSMCFDNDAFCRDIDRTIQYRKGIKHRIEQENSNNAEVAEPVLNENRCCMM